MTDRDSPVRLHLRYPDADTFVARFSPNVTRGGVFIASREPRAVGDSIAFEIALHDGTVVLAGTGKVTWVRAYDPAAPTRPHGMGVQFTGITPAHRPMLERLLRARVGGPPVVPATVTPVRPRVPSAAPARPAGPGAEPGRALADAQAFAEFDEGVEESAIRRARDFAKLLNAREDDLDQLLAPERDEPATLDQALSALPHMLGARRSAGRTGLYRTVPEEPERETRAEPDPSADGGSAPAAEPADEPPR